MKTVLASMEATAEDILDVERIFFTSNTTFLNINVIQSLNKDPDVLGICAIIKQILKEFNFFSALFFYNTIVYF